jgi:hypothetical protein
VDSLEKVIEKLATTEKTTIAIAREEGGKIRVTSGSWDGEKVILKGQVLEVRNVDGRLYVSRKARKPGEWDPPITRYDPYGSAHPWRPLDMRASADAGPRQSGRDRPPFSALSIIRHESGNAPFRARPSLGISRLLGSSRRTAAGACAWDAKRIGLT